MPEQRTHREVKNPQMSARQLADFMAASETARRSIVRGCKYQPIARVIQHDEAKLSVGKFFRSGRTEFDQLREDARRLRQRLSDSSFERDLFDHNADYIERFASVASNVELPDGEVLPPGRTPWIELSGVRVIAEIQFRLRRLTRTNKIRVGAGSLRYAKGTALKATVAAWQSAFLFGYLEVTNAEPEASPEQKLCLTIDAYRGKSYPAPTDSVRRLRHMESACATIAERWPNIAPPDGAIF
jgi:hypothetical protein